MAIILTMLLLGAILGFVGAGGAGFIIAILTLIFHIPIHTALGTSLAAMAFTTLSGTISHFREGNVETKSGMIVGIFGAFGAFLGSKIAAIIPMSSLHWLTGGMLILSSILLIIRLFFMKNQSGKPNFTITPAVLLKGIFLGLITGVLSGTFGIGSTPFIQIGLLTFIGLSVRQSVGTTMLVILPIAIGGGIGYKSEGYLDFILLVQILIGTMTGAYIGAKFTSFAPKVILKSAMITTPAIAGILLFLV